MVELIAKHRARGILVDTNVLLLYLVGSVDPELIRRHKRTAQFTIEDYDTLEELLSAFSVVITTPSILTETNNLAGQIGNPAREMIFAALSREAGVMRERHVAVSRLTQEAVFIDFGITDAGIAVAAQKGYLILTDDFALSSYLSSEGHDVINFNHLRNYP